ncbi:MAG TPA: AAA family ATPase, partial [Isosphaeraceae bacterium]
MMPTTRDDPARYLPDPGLEEAADVAVRLGMPLLLTGEPGVGKTQAAYWLASRHGVRLLEYPVRSVSTASDLFYGYNALAHYHAAGLA